jgi:hypothetical protein
MTLREGDILVARRAGLPPEEDASPSRSQSLPLAGELALVREAPWKLQPLKNRQEALRKTLRSKQ